jgi:hypothetical protein
MGESCREGFGREGFGGHVVHALHVLFSTLQTSA